jgi:predicted nuclease with TOPRIM domain
MVYHYDGPLFKEEEAKNWLKERIKEEIAELREKIRREEEEIEHLNERYEEISPREYNERIEDQLDSCNRDIEDFQRAILFLKSLL